VEPSADGTVLRKHYYRDGILRKTSEYHPNLKIKDTVYYRKNGNRYGQYTEYDSMGRLVCRGRYTYDKRSGFWEFYENGKRVEIGNYYEGMKHGTWKYFDDSGNVRETKVFKNDIEQPL
jgi:antitoxin component YwqK of YwqJK toxin-antitoxin module